MTEVCRKHSATTVYFVKDIQDSSKHIFEIVVVHFLLVFDIGFNSVLVHYERCILALAFSRLTLTAIYHEHIIISLEGFLEKKERG